MSTRPPPDDDDAPPLDGLDDDADDKTMPIDLGGAKDTVEMSTDEINAAIAERERTDAEEAKKPPKK
ncbi:MAG: hypothetical protein Q8O67_29605 [Deltaproteobacteria bacterium]|nr:hypothetical protein [Deltaproteobacteria bacterium]